MANDLDQAWGIVTTLCGWHVTPQKEETITVDATGDAIIFLPTKHLVDVLDVQVDGVTVDPATYSFSEDGMLHFTRPSKRGFRRVTVTIVHGYETAPDIEALAERIAARANKPAEQYSVGSISIGAPGSLMPQSTEWRIIDLYKLGPMP